jgi:hypothetical protein
MSSQDLLPGFTITHLMPLGEAVAIRIDSTGLVAEVDLLTLSGHLIAGQGVTPINSISHEGVTKQVSKLGVEPSPYTRSGIQELIQSLALQDMRLQPDPEPIHGIASLYSMSRHQRDGYGP